MSLQYSHLVVGCGAIGLAVGARLAQAGHRVLLVERHAESGYETSSRNSEVIHAGLYHPPNSLRSKLCIRGKELIYDLKKRAGFTDFQQCGKWIVAQTPQEAQYLEKIQSVAKETGVPLQFVSLAKAKEMEPAIIANEAILNSPTTGIVSSHALMAYYESQLQVENADLAFLTKVTRIQPINDSLFAVECQSQHDVVTINVGKVINCAGLWAPQVASLVGVKQPAFYAKGNYFAYPSSRPQVSRLVYPCPSNEGSLGTHLTLDMGGRLKFGPDFEWVEPQLDLEAGELIIDYRVNETNLERAKIAISRFMKLDVSKLVPDYSGVRPKLSKDTSSFHDFSIDEPVPGFINLMGMESPGLTASMAIAEYVETMAT